MEILGDLFINQHVFLSNSGGAETTFISHSVHHTPLRVTSRLVLPAHTLSDVLGSTEEQRKPNLNLIQAETLSQQTSVSSRQIITGPAAGL